MVWWESGAAYISPKCTVKILIFRDSGSSDKVHEAI